MRKKNYYIGVLSAASLHGASHQAPQELQVVIGSQLKPIEGKNFRIRFLQKKNLAKTNIEKIKTPTGYVPTSSPEETAFDLVRYLRWAGQSNNVVTILQEISNKMDADKLLKVAQSQKELTLTQRLGFLLDMIGMQKLTKKINIWLKQQKPSIGLLQPGKKPFKGLKDKKWSLIVNESLESDL
jgi:predicted transcriptional regulator of viral defense system